MDYELVEATFRDTNYLIRNKRNIIMEFSENLTNDETKKIDRYVHDEVNSNISNTKIIKVSNNTVGSLTIYSKYDGVFLDEIFIEKNYRNKGIGSKIIKNILKNNKIVYLNVYKLNNKSVLLHKKLGFKVIDETETRYFMKFEKDG